MKNCLAYLLTGTESEQKIRFIEDLKDQILPSQEARRFDYELLYGHKLDPKEFKKAMLSLPAVSERRLLVVRTAHKLSAENKNLVIQFLDSKQVHCCLVLEGEGIRSTDNLAKKIKAVGSVVDFSGKAALGIFDMTREIERGRTPEALKTLSSLLAQGIHPLQMVGALIWFWRKSGQRLGMERYTQGLEVLKTVDLNIKRSRLKPEQAMEIAVVQLSVLLERIPAGR